MRFSKTLIFASIALLAITSGCRNTTTLRCERETALLRAEILDLEDKYYALQAQQRSLPQTGSGVAVAGGVIGSGVVDTSGVIISGSPVVVDSYPVQGDVIYDDQYIQGAVIPGTVVSGQVMPGSVIQNGVPTLASPVEGEVYYDGQPYPSQGYQGQSLPLAQPVISQDLEPTPMTEDSSDPGSMDGTPAADEATADPDQSLMLPDSLELEVGYGDLELELSDDSEIDRIEIVTEATRGKDLDGVPGHDGIELMIQTLNADGEFVEQSGELTITVQDQLAGEIGKWTFLPKELQLFLSRDELGNMGTLLHLPWAEKIPVSKEIEIRVGMMIGDVEYIASRKIKVDPPTGGQSVGREIVGWAVDDNRWVSKGSTPVLQRSADKVSDRPSVFENPSAGIQRPQWKPVR